VATRPTPKLGKSRGLGRASQQFVEHLLTPPLDASGLPTKLRYDEDLAVTVTTTGTPIVEFRPTGETQTITEVRAEAEDRDEDPSTFTFVESEGVDRSVARLDDPENPAMAQPWSATVTITKVTQEGNDADDVTVSLGTKTGVRGESDDYDAGFSTVTITRVARERDDHDA
jgi:hypothetical protein